MELKSLNLSTYVLHIQHFGELLINEQRLDNATILDVIAVLNFWTYANYTWLDQHSNSLHSGTVLLGSGCSWND